MIWDLIIICIHFARARLIKHIKLILDNSSSISICLSASNSFWMIGIDHLHALARAKFGLACQTHLDDLGFDIRMHLLEQSLVKHIKRILMVWCMVI
jgi:hypothetical protein